MKNSSLSGFVWMIGILGLLTACREAGSSARDTAHRHDPGGHHHTPPHGGVAVVLGSEAYHVELVLDRDAGRLGAYVLDGHMEQFVRIPAPSLEVVLKLPEGETSLALAAVANPATGETVGDTSHFAARSDLLKGRTNFSAVLRTLTIRGRIFNDTAFEYPRGGE
jgi:hypothetical protein